jgi:hypothetical protein
MVVEPGLWNLGCGTWVVGPGLWDLPDACATQVCIALSSNVESSVFVRHEEPIHDHPPRRL